MAPTAATSGLPSWGIYSKWLTLSRPQSMHAIGLVVFSHSVMSDSLWPHGLQHTRPPCPSPTPGVYSNSCPLSRWCHPTISSSVVTSSSHLQSSPASGSFPVSQFFVSDGQVLEFQLQHQSFQWIFITDFLQDGWVGQSKGLSRVFNTIVQKHQFFGTQLPL